MTAAHATLVRGATGQRFAACDLIPGDLILIEKGDTIPAEAQLIESTTLQTAEAALTGVSLLRSRADEATEIA